jgi:Mn-dependent DtxR family transcriptional regulator
MEHILSAETLERLKDLMKRMTPAQPAPSDEFPV